MSEDAKQMSGPDLAAGIAIIDIADGAMSQGHVGESHTIELRSTKVEGNLGKSSQQLSPVTG